MLPADNTVLTFGLEKKVLNNIYEPSVGIVPTDGFLLKLYNIMAWIMLIVNKVIKCV